MKKDFMFNYSQQIEQPQGQIKSVRSTKTKFLRDLYYKSNIYTRGQKNSRLLSNSKQNSVKNSRKNNRHNSIQQIDSLLQRAIPGAKILKGQWKDHKLNGEVIIEYQNGSKFQGKYQNGMKVQGTMVYTQANCQYQGGFFGQKFSGYGKLTYYNGRIIEGQWDNMQFVGKATITYPNKDVYYGHVDQNLYKDGDGYLFFHNGYKYIGMFKNGSITGIGSYYKDDKLITKGLWQKGKLIKQIINDQFQTGDTNLILDLNGLKQSNKKQTLVYKSKRLNQFSDSQEFSEKSIIIPHQQKLF